VCGQGIFIVIDAGARTVFALVHGILRKDSFSPYFCFGLYVVEIATGALIVRCWCRSASGMRRARLLLLKISLRLCCTPKYPTRILKKIPLGAI
jgi:hypothetical protein